MSASARDIAESQSNMQVLNGRLDIYLPECVPWYGFLSAGDSDRLWPRRGDGMAALMDAQGELQEERKWRAQIGKLGSGL